MNIPDKYYCYILRSTNPLYSNFTYVGSTNNLYRRLRQHNKIISGGAKATAGKSPLEYVAILSGFDNKIEALNCEWRIKHPTGHKYRSKIYCGINGKFNSLNFIFKLDKWTANSNGPIFTNEYILYTHDEHIHKIEQPPIIKSNICVSNIDLITYLYTIKN